MYVQENVQVETCKERESGFGGPGARPAVIYLVGVAAGDDQIKKGQQY
jgi:hypothetical protein